MKKNKPYSIVVLSCWLGTLPWYFPFFIHSCGFNPTIDFVIITDTKKSIPHLPVNIKLVYKTLEQIKKLAAEKLACPVKIDSAYKLCDFKPAYGLIFHEHINQYDFWAQSDIDVIFGDIRSFITPEVLKNDIISVRSEYLTGFFSLHKNIDRVNTLFKKSKDYKKVFSSSAYCGFDECNFVHDLLVDGKSVFEIDGASESMTGLVLNPQRNGNIKAHFDFMVIESVPGHLLWDKGKLIYRQEYEAILYHLISLKAHPLLKIPSWKKIPDSFYINEFSFSKTA